MIASSAHSSLLWLKRQAKDVCVYWGHVCTCLCNLRVLWLKKVFGQMDISGAKPLMGTWSICTFKCVVETKPIFSPGPFIPPCLIWSLHLSLCLFHFLPVPLSSSSLLPHLSSKRPTRVEYTALTSLNPPPAFFLFAGFIIHITEFVTWKACIGHSSLQGWTAPEWCNAATAIMWLNPELCLFEVPLWWSNIQATQKLTEITWGW